jgi:two-component system nitrate/nitrite sensor histidine kinase NarX
MTVDGDCEPPSDVKIPLYRIAQEALSNVVKHVHASHVEVSLHRTAPGLGQGSPDGQRGYLELCVREDGGGFDPGSVSQDQLGLGIMHERAESIHASLEIESEPGGGSQVKVVWPERVGRTMPFEGDSDE